MDTYSDSTVTNHNHYYSKYQPQCQKNYHRELKKAMIHNHQMNDSDIFQSFAEPSIETHPNRKPHSRFTFIKRVKRLFNSKKKYQAQQSASSLPVLSTMIAHQQWNPSIDSISSSATLVRPDQTSSIHSSQSSFTQHKSTLFRHSCGISPLFQKRTKSILKDPIPVRPISMVQKKKRWSNARLSIYEHQDTVEKRYTVQQQPKQHTVKFNKYVRMHDTYSKTEYDRSSDTEAVCNRLTPEIAKEIKQELNDYKMREMVVHEHSRIHNHLFL